MEQYPELKKALMAFRELLIEKKIPTSSIAQYRGLLHSLRKQDFWKESDARTLIKILQPHNLVLNKVKGIQINDLKISSDFKSNNTFFNQSSYKTISYYENGFVVNFQYDRLIVNEIRKIPGAAFQADRSWLIPVTSVSDLIRLKDKYDFRVGDSAKRMMHNINGNLEASYTAEYIELNLPLKKQLYPFQTGGVDYTIRNMKVLIGDQMGLGKTPQSIGAVIGIHEKVQPAFPCLVVSPKSLRYNWKLEWDGWTNKKAHVLDKKLFRQLNRYLELDILDVGIVNYDGLKTLFLDSIDEYLTPMLVSPKKKAQLARKRELLKKEFKLYQKNSKNQSLSKEDLEKWDRELKEKIKEYKMKVVKRVNLKPEIKLFKSIIFDEIHECRNKNTLKFKLSKAAAEGKDVRIGLSGTPIVTGPKDLASILEILGRIEEFGGHYKFIKTYTDMKSSSFNSGTDQPMNLRELNTKLRSLCFIRREKFQVLKDLPEKFRQIVNVDIDNQSEYDHAFNFFQDYLNTLNLSSEQIDRAMRAEMLVQINKLKQISAKGKLSAVKNFVEDVLNSGEKLVVFTWFKDTAYFIKNNFENVVSITGDDSDEEIQENKIRFQEGDAKIIVCTYQKAYAGHTLTAASKFLSIELPWTSSYADQAEDRCHRIGQKNDVDCYYFLGRNTIDEKIYSLIDQRRNLEKEATGGETEIQTSVFNELSKVLLKK
ncbi:MAG: hypothetical protein CL843_09540 [Crocinitomicaceae bacterium]|nr:hypothetical protein [Crocinitomicaceae bacterium]|tara:strand:- start:105 stop:2231 length:2127 start_codon:yes stop_codon:yes gene_type:complete